MQSNHFMAGSLFIPDAIITPNDYTAFVPGQHESA